MPRIIQIVPQLQITHKIEGVSGARETKHAANFSYVSFYVNTHIRDQV